jgi:CheY-like chemotaxis protein
MTVLGVDDEPDLRLVLRELLEIQGHRVAEAGNGVEALAFFARNRCVIRQWSAILPLDIVNCGHC